MKLKRKYCQQISKQFPWKHNTFFNDKAIMGSWVKIKRNIQFRNKPHKLGRYGNIYSLENLV